MNQTYVSLDLETTGLRYETDQIIEIGAVKFDESQIVDTFHSLVNPQRPLPYRIHVLCGINQSELASAPPFAEIAESLGSFIEGNPIVGHNISFDLSFLQQQGINLSNICYDTYELANLLLFQQSDYSLSSLAKELDLNPPKHRALPDAISAKDLFLALVHRARILDIPTIEDIVRLAERSHWKLVHFFRDVLQYKAINVFSSKGNSVGTVEGHKGPLWISDRERYLEACTERTPLDVQKLTDILEGDGLLARVLPSYEYRPEQIRMMQEIAHTFNNSEHLIVEAGTGTGKSIAYLVPSIFFALQNSVPVVISTNTIGLQEQLIGKDIPDLLSTLQVSDSSSLEDFRSVQLKGRSNYLCMKRYEALLGSDRLTLDETKLLARIKLWLLSTKSGDRSELNLSGNESVLWNRICSQYGARQEGFCPHRQNHTCFLHRARESAKKAHIIVVNHALLLSDLVADSETLPPYAHLIIDEAHHIEDEATSQLGSHVTQWDLFDYFNRFRMETGQRRSTGLLPWLDDCLHGSTVASSRKMQINHISQSLNDQVDHARLLAMQFFSKLRDFVEAHTSDKGDYERSLRLTWIEREDPGWDRVEYPSRDLISALNDINETLDQLYVGLQDLEENKVSGYEYLMLEIPTLIQRNDELREQMVPIVSHPEADGIYWITVGGQTDTVGLFSAPLNVSKFLEQSLLSTRDCVILTGATLSTEGNFEYIKGRLGLDYVNELLLDAPFDYLNSAMLYLPTDIPNPNSPGYQKSVEKVLVDLCLACRGRTLVLFTSHSALRATYESIQDQLEQEGILVLGQGIDGSPKQLISIFKSNPESVLLGAASLWEGIDIVGDSLSVLVVARLPFNVPTEPVFAARSEMFDDPFNKFAIPRAAIRFKQGFGRLIRSKNDRGAVVVLDKRLQSKRYGEAFLDSIPQCTITRGSSLNLPSAVCRWLEN